MCVGQMQMICHFIYGTRAFVDFGVRGSPSPLGSWRTIKCVCLVAQSCLTLCNPMDYSPPGPSVYGIFPARIHSGLSFLPPGDLPSPGTKPLSPESPVFTSRFFATWEALRTTILNVIYLYLFHSLTMKSCCGLELLYGSIYLHKPALRLN